MKFFKCVVIIGAPAALQGCDSGDDDARSNLEGGKQTVGERCEHFFTPACKEVAGWCQQKQKDGVNDACADGGAGIPQGEDEYGSLHDWAKFIGKSSIDENTVKCSKYANCAAGSGESSNFHEKSKCQQDKAFNSGGGPLDVDCCSMEGTFQCNDGYRVSRIGKCGDDSNPAVQYECIPSTHNSSKCLENGEFDSDCCAIADTFECADGYQVRNVGFCGGEHESVQYECTAPDGGSPFIL